jgi:vancomycin resistance protein VanJ
VITGEWWRRGWVVAVAAALVMVLLQFHARVPNVGNLGSLLETFLPWLGLTAVPLGVIAIFRRAPIALVAVAALSALWLIMFATTVWPKETSGGELRVVTHNVSATNDAPTATAAALLDADADLVALEEITDPTQAAVEDAFADRFPHDAVTGTVGLWSRYPISTYEPLDLGLSWARALRAVVDTDHGQVAVYVVHLASVRVGVLGFHSAQRNLAIKLLAARVEEDPVRRVIVMGDFNGSSYDRALEPLLDQVRSAQRLSGRGFGFSWPARFPMARIDQILVRGLQARKAWVMARTGSDHRPVAANLAE